MRASIYDSLLVSLLQGTHTHTYGVMYCFQFVVLKSALIGDLELSDSRHSRICKWVRSFPVCNVAAFFSFGKLCTFVLLKTTNMLKAMATKKRLSRLYLHEKERVKGIERFPVAERFSLCGEGVSGSGT